MKLLSSGLSANASDWHLCGKHSVVSSPTLQTPASLVTSASHTRIHSGVVVAWTMWNFLNTVVKPHTTRTANITISITLRTSILFPSPFRKFQRKQFTSSLVFITALSYIF